ncbi:HK97 family phage prohead protease [Micromonospora sp. NPDC007208]|uniref:HK97 family phage prohead protease n=1 Tax=Micromonospora sp. NPDC007208 TaxID=3364236 RepID=UPI0036B4205B
MRTKAFPAHVKAAGEQDGLAAGQFEAIVSVFGNVDHGGDVVLPGAFSRSLAEWKAAGDPIPVIWSHQIGDPDSHIGVVLDAEELLAGDDRLPEKLRGNGGLWVRGQLDLDEPRAAKVHRLLKGRRVTQFSFSYDIRDGALGERDGEKVYELRDLDVFEVGPTLLGMNAATDLVGAKAGRCTTCGNTIDSTKQAMPAPADADDEPPAIEPKAKSAEPTLSPASVLLSLQVDALAYGLD